MVKIKNNESGFSAVEIVVVLVIMILIVAVVWFVYKKHTVESTQNNSNTAQCPPGQVPQYSTIPNSKAYECVSPNEHLVF